MIVGRNLPAVPPPSAGDVRAQLSLGVPGQRRRRDRADERVCGRAARLARALVDRGVGPETLVGLCVERGIGMLTAMLAVWWPAGRTYRWIRAFRRRA